MDYIIARHKIRIEGESGPFARALAPFLAPQDDAQAPILELKTHRHITADEGYEEIAAFDFDDADADCSFGRRTGEYLFRMKPRTGKAEVLFVKRDGEALVQSNIGGDNTAMYRFGMWMMYALAASPRHTVPIHSSVIRWGDGAVMFLGESGTGKSTHTRLWREHIPGSELLNDDSPLIGIADGVPVVYGSPWSGKTPCYRNEHYPIRGIVRLSQAPHNRIHRLPTIGAIGALLPSCPPAFAHDAVLQDHVCATLSEVLASVPVYHLECLPDEAAARLSFTTLFGADAAR